MAANSVQQVLNQRGPLDSHTLAAALVEGRFATNLAGARKQIERARQTNIIASTYPVRFDRSYLYYLEKHQGRRYAQCVKKLLPTKPAFNRVFKAILGNKGWISAGQIGKASGCLPAGDVSKAGGRQTLDVVINHLQILGLLDEVAGERELFRLGKQFGSAAVGKAAFRKKLELEVGLLSMLRDWIRNSFLVAYESNTVRAERLSAVTFNQTYCDFHGPIYFGPFAKTPPLRRRKDEAGFMFGEILGYRTFTINDAESTLERVDSIGHRWKTVSFCPIVVAPSYSKQAWSELRSAGVIALTLRDVCGANVDELMRRFWQALNVNEATDEGLSDIEKALHLASGTIISDGFVGNIKGALFELLVALAYRAAGFDTTLQKMIRKPDEDEEFEVDVVATKADAKCKLVECKGRHSRYTESRDDVERHFHNRCRAAADPLGWDVNERYKEVEAVYITSGTFDEQAIDYASSVPRSHGIKCTTLDRTGLIAFLNEVGQDRLVKIIDTFY